MSYLTNDNRNTIASMLAHERNCEDITEAIGCDPTTISKEESNHFKSVKTYIKDSL